LGLVEREGGRAPDEGELKQGPGSPSTSRNRTSSQVEQLDGYAAAGVSVLENDGEHVAFL
jgi:hypothetical protein